MPIKTYRPTTPTRRFQTVVSREDITKERPEKSLLEPKKRTGGRNSTGRVTSRFIGGGHKQAYRIVDFKRDKTGVPDYCMATVGQVGNVDHENVSLGKAGRTRWLGKTPHNRGVSMNPVDHPHGGGEGKTSGGRHPVTPWGQPTRGFKTRNNKRTDKFIVNRRGKK